MSDLFTLVEEGHRFIEREEWDQALEVLRRAESLDANHVEVLRGLALVTYNLGRTTEAVRYWRRCVQLMPTSAEALLGLAAACFQLGLHEQVLELCERILLLDPQEGEAVTCAVASAQALGRHRLALELAEAGLERNPEDSALHLEAGVSAFELGNHVAARSHLERTLELSEDSSRALAYLLRMADLDSPGQEMDLVGLEALYRRALETHEVEPRLHMWMGDAYARRGLMREARERYREATRLHPELTGPGAGLARIYQALGAPRRAIHHWRRELDLDPTRPEPCAGLAACHQALGEDELAASHLRAALQLSPANHPSRNEWQEELRALETRLESSRASTLASPSSCLRCARRHGRILPSGSLCPSCQVGAVLRGLILLVWAVNLAGLLLGTGAILLGWIPQPSHLLIPGALLAGLLLALCVITWMARPQERSRVGPLREMWLRPTAGLAWRAFLQGLQVSPPCESLIPAGPLPGITPQPSRWWHRGTLLPTALVLTPTATMVLGLSPTMPTVVILLVLIGACLVCPEVLTGLLAGRREGRDAGPGGGHVGAPQRVGFRPRRRRARTASSWRLILLILVGLGLALVAATLLESFVPGSGARLTLLLGAAIPYTTVLVTGLLLLRLRQVVGGSRL